MIKKIFITALLTLLIGVSVKAQSATYRTAIGLRGGYTSGLTIKHFINDRTAIEGIISGWPGLSVTGLVEFHEQLGTAQGLRWYWGVGGHVRSYPYTREYRGWKGWYYQREPYAEGYFGVGVDGILGIEYKIPPAPIAISADIKPFVELGNRGYGGFGFDPSLGFKVTF